MQRQPQSLPWLYPDRVAALETAAAQRILVFDGAMGTSIQACELAPRDFGGEQYEGCNEYLVLTRPGVISSIHGSFLAAGADIVETNTFGGTAIVLAEYGLQDAVHEINAAAARIAREACERYATADYPRFVAGSMGPTTKAITVTGGVTFEQLVENFREQARGLIAGGVDLLLVETAQDTRNVKAALIGIQEVFNELGGRIPVMVSCTIEPMGTMLAGQAAEACYTSIAHFNLFAVGLNCATGPEFMTDHLRSLADLCRTRVSCMPNAGLPDEDGLYRLTPEELGAAIQRFAEEGWLNIVGGCCGTRPEHVAALAAAVHGRTPRIPVDHHRTLYSGIDLLEVNKDTRPVIVGERTNVTGSRLFKRMICDDRWEDAAEVGRRQVKGGAGMVDINLANPDRDELSDTAQFYAKVINLVYAPLVIDSTDARVIELALTYCQGKALINSINLEDGEERFERVVPLARRYGAGLVVGCIDERGQRVSREDKLEVALRSYDLLTTKYGVRPEDIVFDPLVYPCATGDVNYIGSASETIEGIRLIKEALPLCKTVLGISNVSFGIPEAAREVLNAVFLYHCVKAGLDLAIVNSEKIERYGSIPKEEQHLAENLLWNRGENPIDAFVAHFRGKLPHAPRTDRATLPLDERLPQYIIQGSKDGLIADLDLKLAEGATPLEIINGPLMKGMDEVGRLFNANELIVAEVLQSAEAMKAAVNFLEQFMERKEGSTKGTIILATVKGDVHDIGKNLVEIILSNNGFRVINLGIKVPPANLIRAVHEHHPDAIGLSGLLVKSAQQMEVTAADLRTAGITLPILVGGAALSRNFTTKRIRPAYGGDDQTPLVLYAKDAMKGLDLLNRIMDPTQHEALQELARQSDERGLREEQPLIISEISTRRSPEVSMDIPVPTPPDLDLHYEHWTDLDTVWDWINPAMLLGRHMGLKDVRRKLEEPDGQTLRLLAQVEEVKELARPLMQVKGIWQFFNATAEGNTVFLFHKDGSEATRFTFPRQRSEGGLCLADYVMPPMDHVALFVTTAGHGIRAFADELKNQGRYVHCQGIQALALESAEAAAELLHAKLRSLLGFPDPPDLRKLDLFGGMYHGKRYSFGYPACPDLSMQQQLFALLDTRAIGVQLTEGDMMDPEASVSAIVFHHPHAKYFSVGKDTPQ